MEVSPGDDDLLDTCGLLFWGTGRQKIYINGLWVLDIPSGYMDRVKNFFDLQFWGTQNFELTKMGYKNFSHLHFWGNSAGLK